MPESLLPFYVYVLADPDDISKVFYVGMGRDERALSHWKEVRRLIGNQQQGAHPKHERMMAIARDGREPIQAVIGRFETQDEAYAVESTLINWVYGYDNLTNQNRGRNPDQIRPFNCGRELEGIDVERRITDGAVMTLVDLDQQRDRWVQERGAAAKLGLHIIDHINESAPRKFGNLLNPLRLEFRSRAVESRVTYFLDDISNPARTERRLLPNPICRVRMDGSTTTNRLHLEFTKNEATQIESIFSAAVVHTKLSRLSITLRQLDLQSRYDMLIPIADDMDINSIKLIFEVALDRSVQDCLGLTPNNH